MMGSAWCDCEYVPAGFCFGNCAAEEALQEMGGMNRLASLRIHPVMQLRFRPMSDDEITFPTVREAVESALAGAKRDQGDVWVCRGKRIGCEAGEGKCADCYRIDPQDKRSIDDHLRAFQGGDA